VGPVGNQNGSIGMPHIGNVLGSSRGYPGYTEGKAIGWDAMSIWGFDTPAVAVGMGSMKPGKLQKEREKGLKSSPAANGAVGKELPGKGPSAGGFGRTGAEGKGPGVGATGEVERPTGVGGTGMGG
jgi:hypothetical protein